MPVTLLPGRERFVTYPFARGSKSTARNAIGLPSAAESAARSAGSFPTARNTSTLRVAIVLFVAFDIRCLDVIEGKIPTFLIAEFGHPLEEICIKWGLSRQHTDKAEAQHLRLELRRSGEWPSSRRTADKRYELASSHGSLSPRVTPYHTVVGKPCCASPQNWLQMAETVLRTALAARSLL